MAHNLDPPKRQQQRRSPEGDYTEPMGQGCKSRGLCRDGAIVVQGALAPPLPPPLPQVHTPEQRPLSMLTAQGSQGALGTITSLVSLS